MATVTATETTLGTSDDRIIVTTWEGLAASGDVGEAVRHLSARDRCVQFTGTWDSATAVLQGSNDNVTWFTLTDPQGNAISATANALEQVEEIPLWVRPKLTAGSAADIDVILVERRGLR